MAFFLTKYSNPAFLVKNSAVSQMLASVRFVFLILAYGLFRLHNPWVVAVSLKSLQRN